MMRYTNPLYLPHVAAVGLGVLSLLGSLPAMARTQAEAAAVQLPGLTVQVGGGASGSQVSSTVLIALALTVLSLAPGILVCMTSFIRISIVLSMLRHALGLQDTPPNTVLISLALFLTIFTMMPVFEKINTDAVQPLMQGKVSLDQGMNRAVEPLRAFMLKQTRDQELALMAEFSRKAPAAKEADIPLMQLVPAYMLSELRIAFQMGFAVFLPFLLVDMLVATVLMALGMMMVPPATISLPLKLLLFVLIDGWALLVRSILGSFQ